MTELFQNCMANIELVIIKSYEVLLNRGAHLMLRIGCAPRFIYYKLLEAPYIKAAIPVSILRLIL